jgi:hypothetical protein
VKANVDRATADQYLKDLKQIGAKVLIEAATPANSRASVPPPMGAPSSTLPPPVRTTTPPAMQSGLAAAFSGEQAVGDLSALDRLDSMSLSSLDGHDAASFETGGLPASFAPPLAEPLSRPRSESMDLAAPSTPPSRRARPADHPVELFAPPDAEEAEVKVDIAADELEYRARKRTPVAIPAVPAPVEVAAPAPAAASAAAPPARPTPQPFGAAPATPVLAPKRVTATGQVALVSRGGKLGPLSDERVRFAAGALAAVLIGFLPATVIASSLESSAFRSIDHKVDQQQASALDAEDYARLDAFRDKQLDAKKSEKRTATIVGLLVWAAAGAGIAYVWFRRVPWDRLTA